MKMAAERQTISAEECNVAATRSLIKIHLAQARVVRANRKNAAECMASSGFVTIRGTAREME
jgi:hypothetical protein